MPNFSVDQVGKQQHRRNFVQFGGPLPNADVKYAGQDAQYMSITGVSISDTGGIDPIWMPDPKVPGRYRLVGRTSSAPELSQATLVLTEQHGSIPWQLFRQNCPLNAYEVVGTCKDLSDFDNGWSDFVLVYSNAINSGAKDLGDRSAWTDDNMIEDSVPITLGAVYPVGALSFGAKASATITLEVKDVVWGPQVQCGDCGLASDGTRFVYMVQDGVASPATKPKVVYSTDYGATWTAQDVSSAANGEIVIAIAIVGDKLLVVSPAGGTSGSALHWSSINQVTGAPSSSWTKHDVGAIAGTANKLNDVYVLAPTAVFFVGDGGYIYKSTDITSNLSVVDAGSATPQNLARVHGAGDTIVACGASQSVVRSANNGLSWAATTTSPGSGNGTAIWCKSRLQYWYGNNAGAVYYTLDGGETWTQKTYTGLPATAVQDIKFGTDEAGAIAFTVSGPSARLATTINGGRTWVYSTQATPRIANFPSFQRANRIAWPTSGDPATDANHLIVVGLGVGTDGYAALGAASKQ